MVEIAIGVPENRVDHDWLMEQVLALNLPGFRGISNFTRRKVDGVWVSAPRYLIIKGVASVTAEQRTTLEELAVSSQERG